MFVIRAGIREMLARIATRKALILFYSVYPGHFARQQVVEILDHYFSYVFSFLYFSVSIKLRFLWTELLLVWFLVSANLFTASGNTSTEKPPHSSKKDLQHR